LCYACLLLHRGAFDEVYVTALGPSNGCVNPCKDYRGADTCGGDYAISLFRINGMQYDTGAGGCWGSLHMQLMANTWHGALSFSTPLQLLSVTIGRHVVNTNHSSLP
jgi:hypothetical protein